MVSLEEKLSPQHISTKFYRKGGERVALHYKRGEEPSYYLLVENHCASGYHAHVLKLIGDEYVRTDQMITKVGEEYFMENHSRKRASVHVSQKKELDDIVADVREDMLAKLSKYPEEHLRKTISSYARKIYP